MASVGILIVGDEILSGEVRDENGPFLLETLRDAGIGVPRVVVAPDDAEAIGQEIAHLRALSDAVVLSGGIGPTHDDVSRPAVADALGLDLEVHPDAEARIRGWYGDAVTAAELEMSRMPRGAELVRGERTGTFGFAIGGLYVLPGVPALFRDIARGLPRYFSATTLHREELVSNRREGEIAPELARLQGRCLDVAIGSYPVYETGRWHVRVVLRCTDEARLAEIAAAVRALL